MNVGGIIQRQFDALRYRWPQATLAEMDCAAGSYKLIVPNVPLRKGDWDRTHTTVGSIIPLGFPQASPSRFFVEKALSKSHGGMLNNTIDNHDFGSDFYEIKYGHMAVWTPNKDTLTTVVRFVVQQLWRINRMGEVRS
ncbi:E2/UBC family protein [Mesorhizobium sp. M0520]|uniref:E2/UBC family protein n=1 Tax=Mesorhizobium sp. M0520 TaxID=2956957 RepID=UPI00333C77D6